MAETRPVSRKPSDHDDEGTKQDRPQSRSALVAFALLLSGATAAIFLAGGAEQGNLGVFLLCAGMAMIVCPPQVTVKRGVALAALATSLCSATALLPARFFHTPVWRQVLAVVPDLPLPTTVSADPWQTAFWLALLTVTVLTGVFMLTQPVRSRGLLSFALLGIGVCAVYAALSIFAKVSGWTYPFSGGATFGFFPNRNHTATLFVTGSVLSMGVLGVSFRARRWLAVDAAVAALTLCAAGLFFFSESRAGVVFLLVGIVGWVAGLGGRHRDRPLLVAVVVVVLAGGGLFLAFKSGARDRLLGSVPVGTGGQAKAAALPGGAATKGAQHAGEITADDRLRIYRDTLGMIRDAPLTGTGLGTFSLVFAPYRLASPNGNLVLHPESDWLMVAAETGLPALACLGGLILLVLRGWQPSREHPYWPLRWGFLAAAGAAVLHGWVDVPTHRAALGWWVLVLAGLALQPGRGSEGVASTTGGVRAARGVFILGGLLAVFLGGLLVRAEWFGGSPLPPYVAQKASADILRTYEHGEVEGAMEAARRAVRVSPLAAPLYYQLGVLLLRFEETDVETDRAFRLQRLLSPFPPSVPRAQAAAWLPLDPARAAALFDDAVQRRERLPQSADEKAAVTRYFQEIMAQAAGAPQGQRSLWEFAARRGPDFVLAWLESADAPVARERLPLIVRDPAFLTKLDVGQRKRLEGICKTKGDQDALRAVRVPSENGQQGP